MTSRNKLVAIPAEHLAELRQIAHAADELATKARAAGTLLGLFVFHAGGEVRIPRAVAADFPLSGKVVRTIDEETGDFIWRYEHEGTKG